MFYYNLGIVVEVKLCADTLSWCPCTILHLNNTIQLSVCLWPATQKIWMNILSLGAQCYICEIYSARYHFWGISAGNTTGENTICHEAVIFLFRLVGGNSLKCAKMFRCMQIRFNDMPNLHM